MNSSPQNDSIRHDSIRPIRWQNDALFLLDQRRLPESSEYLRYAQVQAVISAIQEMVVRGAPAIGIAAAYGAVLAAREAYELFPADQAFHQTQDALRTLAAARPTAVNLAWAVDQAQRTLNEHRQSPVDALIALANRLFAEDLAANYAIGALGAELLGPHQQVLTHCNAGALATSGYGTALGVIRSAWAGHKIKRVFAGETRPWNQGARLTIWELSQEGIPATLIADSAAAHLMRHGDLDWVIVGADRITANGDTVNKIGTYGLSVLARQHGVRVMVAAPSSTLDWALPSGDEVPIENRQATELLPDFFQHSSLEVSAWNPVFDITPAAYIDAIVTEKGVVMNPDPSKMAAFKANIGTDNDV